jgi:tRNA (cytosine38-C5)-methyltransferase
MGDRPKTTDNVLATNCEDFSYVEFYSGIGGWTMALEEAVRNWSSSDDNTHQSPQRQLHLRRIAALDHSDLCMRVFQHNFGSDKKSFQIERLTLKQVEEWRATVWMMSPPCQPHTRQHSNQQKDLFDSRSSSFLHICSLISQMKEDTLPRLILCENVVGFENSNSFQKWRTALAERDYYVGHFHLSPTQVGMPNDRPRYYCVAVQKTALTDSDEKASLLEVLQQEDAKNDGPSKIYTSIPGLGSRVPKMYQISSFLDKEPDDALVVPENLLKSNAAWCFDIITPNDRRSRFVL